MASTVNSDLIIYNDLAQTAYLERIQDVLDVFNANSAGALVLASEAIEGDLRKRTGYQIGGSIAHRNVNSTTGVTPDNIDPIEMVGVKCPWKYGPYASTEEAFKRRARSPEEFSILVGQDLADAVMAGWVAYALGAAAAAIQSNPTMVVPGNLAVEGKKVLTKGMRTLGDRFSRLAVWVMDSSLYFDIVDQAITDKIYEEAGVVVYGGSPGTLGKPVLVTDTAPAGLIMGLQPGAVTTTESQAPGIRSYEINNEENLAIGFRAEGAVNVDVRGYSWDEQAGGTNPTLGAISDPDHWDKYATSNKATAGFIIDLTGNS